MLNKMLGVRRYQQTQCKRLAKPKDSNIVVQRSSSQLSHSLTRLQNNRYANEDKDDLNNILNKKSLDNTLKLNDGSYIPAIKLINKNLTYLNKRENKLSRSFYGTLKAHSLSEAALNNTYGEDNRAHQNRTIEQANNNNHSDNRGKGRSKVTSLIQNKSECRNPVINSLMRKNNSQKGKFKVGLSHRFD